KGVPVDVKALVLAVPYDVRISKQQLRDDLERFVIKPTLNKYLPKRKTKFPKITINGTGAWEIGGPNADTGVTGRKIIVDTYGGMGRHGGGCFSGKDASKVDRSGAYACRYLAKNIVAAKLADRCEVKVAYVIGKKDPISMDFDTFGTGKKSKKIIQSLAKEILDFSVPNIIKKLNLRRPIYAKTARYGHFGNKKYPWEKVVV
ncbi:MAG: methionine adenosyltransferase domain-containing protein, partial [Patescibacteria group bacterium]